MESSEIIKELLIRIDYLTKRVEELEKENKELRRRLSLDSSNSSKPPSSDALYNRKNRLSIKKKTKRKPGGQAGHKGHQLKKFEEVDYIADHQMDQCPHCKSDQLELKDCRIRQVADIPKPKLEITEHKVYSYQCGGCGESVRSELYEELKQQVQYGPRIKALVNYLNVYQLIPYKRLSALIGVLYGHKISQGSISNFNAALSDKLALFEEQLKKSLIESRGVLHSDETGCIVSKAMHWLHVYSDGKKTLLQGHFNRGRKAMDEIGILSQTKATVVHDRFSSYDGYQQIEHALCNAHLLRDLKSIENKELTWSSQIKNLLLQAKKYKDSSQLTPQRAKRLQLKYESILRAQRPYYQQKEKEVKKLQKGNPKRSRDHNLYRALWKYRHRILRFIHDPDVPFDNNQAERDLRMFKVKMKISNQFKTIEWMNIHARIRSFISTTQKQKFNILQYITMAHINPNQVVNLAV